eukprot:1139480-Pelagomonas_calceolata.AAC.2
MHVHEFGGCAAPTHPISESSLPMSALTKPAPRAFTNSFDYHPSRNIVAFHFCAGDDMISAA